jgi:4-hydroxy-3-methylbut-2-en-1-yl diphosphate reductase
MKILRAEHLGMCFGVRDAIAMAKAAGKQEPTTILGELVHNETVLEDLRKRGIRIARLPSEVSTNSAMITAHGASRKAIAAAQSRGLQVSEATCPLVRSAHRAVESFVQSGCHPVIIGKKDHVEVKGLTEDLLDYDVILTEAEIMDLRPREKFGVAAQTTQPIERVRHLVGLLRWRFPESEVRFIDTVCQPTKQRQNAAVELASQCDAVVVVGGLHSNNTRELAKTCAALCPRVFQVETAADLRTEWLVGAEAVGLTAGTSTPDEVIAAVEHRLHEIAATCLNKVPASAD